MNPLNVSRVVNNPAMQQSFTIQRNTYTFQNEGEWTKQGTENIGAKGIVTPSTAKDRTEFLPEGQREVAAITIYSPVAINNADGNSTEADVILWNGNSYRVQYSKPWASYGYWFVVATFFIPT